MTHDFDTLVQNAQDGTGPCCGCPAQEDTHGQFVNPGLINPKAELMFLTMDPSHQTDWELYDDWTNYNADKSHLFRNQWPGGTALSKLLEPISGVTVDDIWLADAVKCPVNNDLAGDIDSDEVFDHCSAYLRDEIRYVNPRMIVTMGNDPAKQVLGGLYDMDVSRIKAGTVDCGRIFDTNPPVVVSPHWGHGWLRRNDNRRKVQDAINEVLESRSQSGSNVFLVPCDSPNYDRTVRNRIDLADYSDPPDPLDKYTRVRLWGARSGEGNQTQYDQMGPGDLVIFYQDGRYIGVGKVGTKFEDKRGWIRRQFWGNAPSSLIYTVEDFRGISCPRGSLNSIFNYKESYYPQGLTRVADDRVTNRLAAIKRALEMRYGINE